MRSGEDPTVVQARADFDEALARQTARDWVGALVLLRKVAAVRATPHVRFNIALCEEFLGKLNPAIGDYAQAAKDAAAAGARDVEAEANRRREALAPRIPTLVLALDSTPPGASVCVDGVELGAPAFAGPLPLDPGLHVVDGTAPGYKPFRASFILVEGQRRTLEPAWAKK